MSGNLIALCGFARSGKDSFADSLVDGFGYKRVGFADPMYQMSMVLDPILFVCFVIPVRLSWLVRAFGWTNAKWFSSVRRYLQTLGTECCRDILGEDVWVNHARPRIAKHLARGENVIVTNVRFPNELGMIEDLGGTLVRIDRPGFKPINNHKSDAGLAFGHAKITVENRGSKDDLAILARNIHYRTIGARANRQEISSPTT